MPPLSNVLAFAATVVVIVAIRPLTPAQATIGGAGGAVMIAIGASLALTGRAD